MRTSGHLALVTGGSSGIGLAIARALAGAGNTVVLGARDPERLAAAARQVPGAGTVRLDIADTGALPAVLDQVRSRYGPVSLLVNSAGTLHRYRFADGDPSAGELVSAEILTNVLGTVELTRLALPQLLAQPEAAVITLSSVLAHVAVPRLPVYAATKAAVHSFSRSLRASLAGTPVRVFDVLPPLVDTPMAGNIAGAKVSPEAVAGAVLAALARERYEIHVGQAKRLARLSRLAPALADRIIASRLRPAAG
jgi:uncharacterized oxidoreductase